MKKRKYIIVDSRRFFTFITLLFLLGAIIVITFVYSPKVHSSLYSQRFKEYNVVEGDTLWRISQSYIPEGYDTRRMIYEIKKANNMEDSNIYSGKTIKIPIINK